LPWLALHFPKSSAAQHQTDEEEEQEDALDDINAENQAHAQCLTACFTLVPIFS
jgi:hypothetical protein